MFLFIVEYFKVTNGSVLFFLLATLERLKIEFNFTCSIRGFYVVLFSAAAYQA